MEQDEITGAFIFYGGEPEIALRYVWTVLMDLSWHGKIDVILRILFKNPPKWVEYKNPEYYKQKSLEVLNKMAGKQGR